MSKLAGLLEYLDLLPDIKRAEDWLLTEKETVCLHNCGRSYVELKGFLHE
jgi:hypothetical protein